MMRGWNVDEVRSGRPWGRAGWLLVVAWLAGAPVAWAVGPEQGLAEGIGGGAMASSAAASAEGSVEPPAEAPAEAPATVEEPPVAAQPAAVPATPETPAPEKADASSPFMTTDEVMRDSTRTWLDQQYERQNPVAGVSDDQPLNFGKIAGPTLDYGGAGAQQLHQAQANWLSRVGSSEETRYALGRDSVNGANPLATLPTHITGRKIALMPNEDGSYNKANNPWSVANYLQNQQRVAGLRPLPNELIQRLVAKKNEGNPAIRNGQYITSWGDNVMTLDVPDLAWLRDEAKAMGYDTGWTDDQLNVHDNYFAEHRKQYGAEQMQQVEKAIEEIQGETLGTEILGMQFAKTDEGAYVPRGVWEAQQAKKAAETKGKAEVAAKPVAPVEPEVVEATEAAVSPEEKAEVAAAVRADEMKAAWGEIQELTGPWWETYRRNELHARAVKASESYAEAVAASLPEKETFSSEDLRSSSGLTSSPTGKMKHVKQARNDRLLGRATSYFNMWRAKDAEVKALESKLERFTRAAKSEDIIKSTFANEKIPELENEKKELEKERARLAYHFITNHRGVDYNSGIDAEG